MQMIGTAPTEPVLCAISPQELFQSQVLANIQNLSESSETVQRRMMRELHVQHEYEKCSMTQAAWTRLGTDPGD